MLKSPAAHEALEAAMLHDKALVIAAFTAQGKLKEFEDNHGIPLDEYLDGYLDRPGIFEGVCEDSGVSLVPPAPPEPKCPTCGGEKKWMERSPHGNSGCVNGHTHAHADWVY